MSDFRHDAAAAAVKSSLPIAGTATAYATAHEPTILFGFTVSEWAALVTIGFVVLQIAHLLWKWRREARR